MIWLIYILAIVFILFTFVIMFGAPFLPTLKKREHDALDLLNLKPGQTLLELGSGDGRILRQAAAQGITAIGFELNPLLVIYSRLLSIKYGRLVRVHWRNFWWQKIPTTDGIYVFLLQPYMAKLDKKIVQEYGKPVKLVSFAFTIPGKKPAKEKNGMFLYRYF